MQEFEKTEFRVVRTADEAPDPTNSTPNQNLFIIEESLGYVLNTAAKMQARILSAYMLEQGVAPAQWLSLLFLWAEDGQTQTQLSRHISIDDATMVRTLDRMERDGLVQRVRNVKDRRQYNICLTEKGRSLREVLIPYAVKLNTEVLGQFTAEEQTQLFGFLKRIIQTTATIKSAGQPDGIPDSEG